MAHCDFHMCIHEYLWRTLSMRQTTSRPVTSFTQQFEVTIAPYFGIKSRILYSCCCRPIFCIYPCNLLYRPYLYFGRTSLSKLWADNKYYLTYCSLVLKIEKLQINLSPKFLNNYFWSDWWKFCFWLILWFWHHTKDDQINLIKVKLPWMYNIQYVLKQHW